jgi:hypothetical protein
MMSNINHAQASNECKTPVNALWIAVMSALQDARGEKASSGGSPRPAALMELAAALMDLHGPLLELLDVASISTSTTSPAPEERKQRICRTRL